MTNFKTRLVVLLLCTFCLLTGAYGQFTPAGDSYTDTAFQGRIYGAKEALTVSNGAGGTKRVQTTFIQFNLSAIPSTYTGANVAKASLKLYVTNVATPGSFNVDYVNGPWSENTINYNNAPAYGSTIAANIPLDAADTNQYIVIDITAAVQAWLDGTPDYGIALVGNDPMYAAFESKENTSTSHPPELDIVFASGIGTITGVTTANGSGLTGGGTSGTLNLSLATCANNQILVWNNGGWGCSNVVGGGGGTVTSVGSGTGLTGGPITSSGTLAVDPNTVPLLGLENQFTASQSILGSLTATYLGASGTITAGGGAVFPSTGNSPTSGSPSSPLDLTASASNGTTASYQTFRWQAANVDATTPSANLNLLFGAAGAAPAPTGLSIAPNGIISFAPNQTFPGGGGGGITNVVAGTGLSGGGSTPTVTLNVNQGLVAFQSDLTAGIATAETTSENYASANFLPLTAASSFATIGANAFTGNQTITGSLFASGNVGVGTTTPHATLDVSGNINIGFGNPSVINFGGIPFAFGDGGQLDPWQNTYLGFAGNLADENAAINGAFGLTYNTGVGSQALSNPASGSSFNTAVGVQGLQNVGAGQNNTATGYQSLMNGSGSQNTADGASAGQAADSSAITGSANTFLGNATKIAIGSFNNATAVGASALVGESNALVLGSINGVNNATASVNVGIGTTTPQSTLDVHGNTSITGNLNVTGSVTCGSGCGGGGGGGSGTVTSVAVGTGLLASPSPITTSGTLSINTAVVPQLSAANTFTGTQTISNGSLNLTGTPGSINATGEISTNGLIFAGSMSTFGTVSAGSYTLGGTTVLAHAPSTGGSLLLGENTGNSTLLSSLDISSTTAIGDNTLRFYTGGNYNTALGNSALYEATSGSNNTGAGYEALFHNTSGSNNTAMGYNAGNPTGFQNTTGSNDTFLGANSGVGNQLALNYATAIGSGALVGQNNAMVLGGPAGSAAAVNVGIGTATPQATLDVEGTAPTVNFGSTSNQATLTVNGSLNVTGAVTCGSGCGGGGGGGITNVIAGTDLTGGGTGPTVTLNLNTSATDLRYSQLGATNTFTNTQTINTSTGNGVSATSSSGSASGLSGSNTATTGSGNGVAGSTSSPLGSGVVGVNLSTATSGGGYGVYGLAGAPANVGVGGVNNTTAAGNAYGVFGQSFGSTGAGVYGTGIGSGVTGSTSSPTGSGVVATNFASSGNAYGVYAQSSTSSTGTGVYGTGSAAGVTGQAASSNGIGVLGLNSAGWAGFFQGSVNITNNLSVVNNAQVLGNAAVTGTLSVGGDTPMSHSPRMTFSGTVANFTTSQFQPAGYFVPDQAIVITRLTTATGNQDNISQCDPGFSQMGFIAGSNPVYLITTGNVSYADSGPLNIPVAAGAPIQIVGLEASGGNGSFCQSGGNMTATIQYAMQ